MFSSSRFGVRVSFVPNTFTIYPQHFLMPEISETVMGSFTKLSALSDQNFSTEKRDTPLFITKTFRHQNFFKNCRVPSRNFSAMCDKNFSSEFSDIPFLCINFCETRNFLKHRTVPQRHFSELCDKSFRGRNLIPPPSLMNKIWRCPKFFETLKGCPPNISALWHQKLSTKKHDTPY